MTPADLSRLSTLLDEVLDLPLPKREAWLTALKGEAAALTPMLRKLLAREASKKTNDLLERGPSFTAPGEPDAAPAFQPGDTVGPYRLQRELGRGGMGEVWLAERHDGQLKRAVALKLPMLGVRRSVLVQRFARERDILAGLVHPHIARLYDAGLADDGQPYLALEYVDGQAIGIYCHERGLAVKARLRLLLQVADAVAYAHGRLVLHRDLKPSNILVTADGQVRLLDFGIAKLMEGDSAEASALTQASGRALTLEYASPEQVRGEAVGTATDVYSLAVVAYELLSGARPYRLKRQSAAALEEAITLAEAPSASAVAKDPALKQGLVGDLDAILNKALKKLPADRYPTVDALAQDWRRHLEGYRVAARPDTLRYRLQRVVRRHRVPLAAGAVVAAAFVLSIGFGATAAVVLVLLLGLGAALWQAGKARGQARIAAAERDRALALADRNAAVNVFLNTLLTRAARSGPLTATQLLERSEQQIERGIKGNAEHRAYVLGLIASYYGSLDDHARAAPVLERAVEAARGIADTELRDSLESQQALVRGRLGEMKAAISAIEAILARPNTTPEVRSKTHTNRSLLASFDGDSAGALQHAIEALRWYRASRHLPPQQEGQLLGDLGWAHLMQGQGDEADRYCAEAMAVYERLGMADSVEFAQLNSTWALAVQEMGDLPRSLELFDRGLALSARAEPDTPPPVYAVANRAYTLTKMGRYAEAETAYRRAVEIARGQGSPLLAYTICMVLAELYAEQGRVELGERELAHADAERKFEVPENSAAAFTHQLASARLALLRGQTEAAVAVYTKALDPGDVAAGVVSALLGRSGALLSAGRIDPAEADARAALEMAQQLQGRKPASFRTGLAWLALARVSAARDQAAEARQLAASALPQLKATLDGSHPALAEARRLAQAPDVAARAILPSR